MQISLFQVPTLTDSQLEGLANILADAGQVFFASLIVPFFFNLEDIGFLPVLLGTILTSAAWISSLQLLKEVKQG